MSDCDCQETARQAVREVFLLIGVDVDSHSEVENFRENLRMSNTLRKVVDKSFFTILGLVITAGFYGLLHKIGWFLK